jgi:hypothetical protein
MLFACGEYKVAALCTRWWDCGALCRNRKARMFMNRGINDAFGLVFCSISYILTWQLNTGRFMEHAEGVDLAQL